MCQKDLMQEEISAGIRTWRVQTLDASDYYCPLFSLNHDGTPCSIRLKVWPLWEEVKAAGYNEGFGFMSFTVYDNAVHYRTGYCNIRCLPHAVIVIATVPEGARFTRGQVAPGYIGEGIPTIRSDRIILGR